MWAVVQRQEELREGPMRAPDEVAAMVRLKALGWPNLWSLLLLAVARSQRTLD